LAGKGGHSGLAPKHLFTTVGVGQSSTRSLGGAGYRADLGVVFADGVGEYRKPDSVTSTACRIAQKAGFKGVSLHNLRHSNGSQLLSAGVPLPVVSARLGHSSPYVTATVYSHALKADEQQAADKKGSSAPTGKERGSSKAQELGSAMEDSSAFSQIPCFRR
jgi:hypothetical protein